MTAATTGAAQPGGRFPRARSVDVVYDPVEDRIAASFTLARGLRRLWLTRPVTLDLLTRLSALLQAQSPWRGRVAGSGLADAEDVERQAARAMAERDGRIRRGVAVSRPGASGADGTAWLVSRVLVEGVDGDAACVRVGLAGAALGSASAAAPLAALELDRAQAQEFLSVVQEKALRAGWVRGAAATGQRQQTTH